MMQDDDGRLVATIRDAIRWAFCEDASGAGRGQCSDDCICLSEANIAVGAALTAIEREGFKVVPVEPTEEMKAAGVSWMVGGDNLSLDESEGIFSAMLSAAPKQG